MELPKVGGQRISFGTPWMTWEQHPHPWYSQELDPRDGPTHQIMYAQVSIVLPRGTEEIFENKCHEMWVPAGTDKEESAVGVLDVVCSKGTPSYMGGPHFQLRPGSWEGNILACTTVVGDLGWFEGLMAEAWEKPCNKGGWKGVRHALDCQIEGLR